MERKFDAFRTEAAGSLTPELEGAPRSVAHPRITKEKGRSQGETGQQKTRATLDISEKRG